MSRRLALAAALAVILVGVALSYQSAAFSSRSGADAPVYSVQRHDPYGTAALMDLLSERGIPVRTLEHPTLDASDHGVLIQVLSAGESGASPPRYHLQNQRIDNWISQGNTVIQFTRSSTDLMERYKIAPSTQPVYGDAKSVEQAEVRGDPPDEVDSGHELADVNGYAGTPLLLWSPMTFEEHQTIGWRAIARLPEDARPVVAGELPIGKGKLIIVGAPTPALNGTLGQEGNVDFLLAVIGKGPVIFDEWSHGVGHEATVIGFLHDVGLFPVLLQLTFLAALYGWSSWGFRRPDDHVPARQRSSIEQIETLGFLYSRSLDFELTLGRIDAEVRRRLAESMRCPVDQINNRLITLKPEIAAKIKQMLESLAQAAPAHGPRCTGCGYDLSMNETGRCPECGIPIPANVRQRIAETPPTDPAGSQRRPVRLDAVLADVLTTSHQLAQEVQRERRVVR